MSFHTPSRTSMNDSEDIPTRVWTSPMRQRIVGSTPSTYTASYQAHDVQAPTPSPGTLESPLYRPLSSPTRRDQRNIKESTYAATFGNGSGQVGGPDYALNMNRVVLPRAQSPFRASSSYADTYNTTQFQPREVHHVTAEYSPAPAPAATPQPVAATPPTPATPAPLNLSNGVKKSSPQNDYRSPPSKRTYAGPTDHGDRSKSPLSTTQETYTGHTVQRAVSPRTVREEYAHQAHTQKYIGPTDGGLRVSTPASTTQETYTGKSLPQQNGGAQERARSPRVFAGLQRSVSPLPFGVPQSEDSTYRTSYTQMTQRPPAHEYPDATRHFSPSRGPSPLPRGGPTPSSSYAAAYGAASPRAATVATPTTPPPAYMASPHSAANRLISPRSTDEILPAGVPHLSVRPERPPATQINHTSEYYESFTRPGNSGPAALPAAGDHSKMTRRPLEERPARSPSTGVLNTTYYRDFTTPTTRSLTASTCSELTLNPAEAPSRADTRGGITSPTATRRAVSPSPGASQRAVSPSGFGRETTTPSYSSTFNDAVSPARAGRIAPESLPPAGRASNRTAQARTPPPTTMTSTYQETYRRTIGGDNSDSGRSVVYAARRSMPLSAETTYTTEFGAKPMNNLTASR